VFISAQENFLVDVLTARVPKPVSSFDQNKTGQVNRKHKRTLYPDPCVALKLKYCISGLLAPGVCGPLHFRFNIIIITPCPTRGHC
jgi:hypothetical protein